MAPEQRFMIGAQMFETARAFAIASFPSGITPSELRYRLCERLYGQLAAEAYPTTSIRGAVYTA